MDFPFVLPLKIAMAGSRMMKRFIQIGVKGINIFLY